MKARKKQKKQGATISPPARGLDSARIQPPDSPDSETGNRKRWGFRLAAAMLVPVLLLGVVELALRLAGFGYSTAFFRRTQIQGREVVVENQQFTWRFFPKGLARYPEPLAMAAAKPTNCYRIFVLGESAALGDPEPSYGFSRILEVLLRDRFPKVPFEVVNVGITAINSHVIREIAAGCAAQRGDLWVIYMGNNEVVGPFGAGTIFGTQAPSLAVIRGTIGLKATRVGQLLVALKERLGRSAARPQEWGGMAMFAQNKVYWDAPQMKTVYHHFKENLDAIVRQGLNSGARVALCTVASNLKDCAPFASMHRRGLSEAESREWNSLYQAGDGLEKSGKTAEAVRQYLEASRIDGQFADLRFRLGRCYGQLGDYSSARTNYVLARDTDALRFRADSRVNEIIRQTASAYHVPELALIDLEELISRSSPQGLGGDELFYEHVHFNFDGNYLVAKALAETVAAQVRARLAPAESGPWLSSGDCARQLAWTPWNRYQIFEDIHKRLAEPPFTFQLDHAERMRLCEKAMAELRPQTKPYALKMAASEYRRALAAAPEDWRLHYNFANLSQRNADDVTVEEQWRQVLRLMPHHSRAHCSLGLLLDRQGKVAEARDHFMAALRVRPDFPDALIGLAQTCAREKNWPEAVAYNERALLLRADDVEAHRNLAQALAAQKKLALAIQHYETALKIRPDQADVHLALAGLLRVEGRIAEAIVHGEEAVRLDPTFAGARFQLGELLSQHQRRDEAIRQFQEVLRINPNHTEARQRLTALGVSPGI